MTRGWRNLNESLNEGWKWATRRRGYLSDVRRTTSILVRRGQGPVSTACQKKRIVPSEQAD